MWDLDKPGSAARLTQKVEEMGLAATVLNLRSPYSLILIEISKDEDKTQSAFAGLHIVS